MDVMPKPEILDPQGQAVAGALHRLGVAGVTEVRQGKHFELEVDDAVDDDTLHRIAGSLLANPVIEDWVRHAGRHLRRARIGVITFPGTLDDVDAARAVRLAGGEPVSLWHADHDLRGVDAVVVPGGFSYGDYLRAGAIAARAPIMDEVVAAADRGMPVLGICNGFQILCEAGLLPGALTRNAGLHFVCRDLGCASSPPPTAWTGGVRRRARRSSSRSSRARAATSPTPPRSRSSRREGRVVFRYVDAAPERVDARHRRDRLGERPGRGADAAPRARDRPADRARRRTASACSPRCSRPSRRPDRAVLPSARTAGSRGTLTVARRPARRPCAARRTGPAAAPHRPFCGTWVCPSGRTIAC